MLSWRKVLSPPDFDPSLWAAIAVALAMAGPLVLARRHYLAIFEVHPPQAGGAAPLPDCMVVIPARNEEGSIGPAVASLPSDTVIVVDDFSTDRTAAEARAAGAGVIAAPPLNPGESGKANACLEGARVLTSRWILFADADTVYKPGFLTAAVAAAESARVDFLSIYLQPACATLRERLLSPFAVALYFCAIHPAADAASGFLGHCLLVRRDPYAFIGGHKPLLDATCDDLKLAQLAARHRMKFAVVRAPRLGRVRLRPRDFERNARRFAELGFAKSMVVGLTALVCALWLPALLWLLAAQHWTAAAIFFFLPGLLLSPWYGWPAPPLAPLGIYGMLPILLGGLLGSLTRRRLHWKGRVI